MYYRASRNNAGRSPDTSAASIIDEGIKLTAPEQTISKRIGKTKKKIPYYSLG